MARRGKPGRPKGSKTNDYSDQLKAAADILLKNPDFSNRKVFCEAIKKNGLVGLSKEANLKALQRAWREDGEREKYLQEARERQLERNSHSHTTGGGFGIDPWMFAAAAEQAEAVGARAVAALAMENTVQMRAVRELTRISEQTRAVSLAVAQIREMQQIASARRAGIEALERHQALLNLMNPAGVK